MKYIKTYEKRQKGQPHKGYRQKEKDALEKAIKFKKYVPGLYIIFSYTHSTYTDEPCIIFGKIISVDRHEPISYSYTSYGPEDHLKIMVLNYIEPIEARYEWITIGKEKSFNLALVKNEYITNSLKVAEKKYEELSYELQVRLDANKYNM